MNELTTCLDLPLGPDAPAVARRAVRSALDDWAGEDRDWLDDAVLIADELVANAVRHGGGCLQLQIRVHGQDVTITAVDGSAVVPRRRSADSEGGRGLAIIETLAQSWGVTDLDDGHKAVWVRLAPIRPDRQPASPASHGQSIKPEVEA
ncbi:ATP-binding protein [Micromonospora endolithica]|uniref:ATP-binding protein n=1 Tax=Micromonospora endolithica TaxID=230091 RepID=A0A3A9YRM9_9ACTN|nr:ATP-binding protein [Micromonospora endolithica]RKN38630.1 ATP-binding protein [Micromonospora endolithica]TWJ25238.1 anti-sigma regulatory factor (Ser/Thr protein kinase) [Micromonospora endolithica]